MEMTFFPHVRQRRDGFITNSRASLLVRNSLYAARFVCLFSTKTPVALTNAFIFLLFLLSFHSSCHFSALPFKENFNFNSSLRRFRTRKKSCGKSPGRECLPSLIRKAATRVPLSSSGLAFVCRSSPFTWGVRVQ